jgi:uncharacterized protein (DUF2336 family)
MPRASIDLSAMLTEDLSGRSAGERSRIVRDLAGLFLHEPERYSASQVQLFDEVLSRLIRRVDEELRAELARELAPVGNAPREVMMDLASDRRIAVAGPVLAKSPCLDEEFLIATAKTRGQEHLVAISSRERVGDRVTDILVERGNGEVVLTLARNGGARLSDRGRSVMLERAQNDAALARVLCHRPDIPRQQILAVIEKASAAVRQDPVLRAEAGAPQLAVALEHASQTLQDRSRSSSAGYARAKARIAALKQTGGLSESHISSFAREGLFEEVVVAIAEMTGLPTGDMERIVFDDAHERLFIVAKAIGLSWATLRQVLLINYGRPRPSAQLEHLRAKYQCIPREASAKTLQYHQLREKARRPAAD